MLMRLGALPRGPVAYVQEGASLKADGREPQTRSSDRARAPGQEEQKKRRDVQRRTRGYVYNEVFDLKPTSGLHSGS